MEGGDDVYVTELREPLSRSPVEKTFFARLDAELTKVNKFYKKKEGEYIARAGVLEKQMLALIHLEEDMAREGLMSADFLTKTNNHLPGMNIKRHSFLLTAICSIHSDHHSTMMDAAYITSNT